LPALQRSAALPKTSAGPCSCDHDQHGCGVAGGLPASQSKKWGRRPQRPGNQFALSHLLEVFPSGNSLSRITGCRWPAAIIQQAQELSRFSAPTVVHFVLGGNTKRSVACEEAVDHNTSLWNNEEN
jgi:hypothetical protein